MQLPVTKQEQKIEEYVHASTVKIFITVFNFLFGLKRRPHSVWMLHLSSSRFGWGYTGLLMSQLLHIGMYLHLRSDGLQLLEHHQNQGAFSIF